ncbi:MAG: xanthine dehydrogenase family protein molybdopterin-binding subunit [Bacteroidota bacterium]
MNKDFSIIGKSLVREDGLEKITGKAKFADDFKFEGMLYTAMLRIPATHAAINSIDFSAVINNPSIKEIITLKDVPGTKKIGMIKSDQPVFCNEKVVTPGDVLAMLVGEDENELRELVKKIKVDYTLLPTVTNPVKALEENSLLIHPEYGTNLICHHPLHKGDIERGFAESSEILEQVYTTQTIEHAYIEAETVIALPIDNGGVKVIGSIQNPFSARRIVCSVLNLPPEKVQVIQAQLGGSFGGKDDTMCMLSSRAAVAALKVNRPVKIRYSREDSILESYKRHPYILKYKVGFSKYGKINAMKIDLLADGGAYCSMSPFVTWRSVVQATGPYEIENVQTDVRAVYTNNPYTGAMRGFGSPQPIFAQESIMDEIAVRVGITPDEIRRRNGLKIGSVTATGQTLRDHDVNLIPVLDKACAFTNFASKWNEYKKKQEDLNEFIFNQPIFKDEQFIQPEKLIKKGIGLAVSYRGCSLGAEGLDQSSCFVSIQPDEKIVMLSGLAENGQGLRMTLLMAAAEALGVSADKITFLESDTFKMEDSGPTVASRGTLMGAAAAKNACDLLRSKFESIVREEFEIDETDFISFKENLVLSRKKGLIARFDDVVKLAAKNGSELSVIGRYKSPDVSWDEHTGQGDAYFTYVYGCQVAEVSVNTGTGEIYLNKITAVHDPGTVINRLGAIGQVYGGVTQGSGYGILEEVTSEDGMIRELNFDQYLIPTAKDIDEIKPLFLEGEEKYGAWGAKSLGEPTLELGAAAIANAVCNALGKRFYNLPLNLEEVLLGRKLRPQDLKRGSL